MAIEIRFKDRMFFLFAFLSLTMMVSCGGSDDDNDNIGGNSASRGKRLSKIVEETKDAIYERSFTYDNQGRITEMDTKVTSASETGIYKSTYQYGETLIIKKFESNQTASPLASGTHTYTLKDGRIVLDAETRSGNTKYVAFTYDQEGKMDSYSGYFSNPNDEYQIHRLTWKDGNLMEIDLGYSYAPYAYSNLTWTAGLMFDISQGIVPDADPILFATGFYGKLPKNLPSKIDNVSYEYTTSGGLVTKIKRVWVDTTGYYPAETCTINITWE